jgi:Flp pilus assembly protein TadB
MTGSTAKMQNSKMPNIAKVVIFIASCIALLVDVAFIAWATRNPLIVVPVALAAAYLAYAAAHWTIPKLPQK